MIVIAEKLNGSIPTCAKAIAERNADYIRDIAKKESEAGATFIDVCASVKEHELETLKWMIDLVQEVTDTPISVDSPDVHVCVEGIKLCKKPGLFNSVSGEGDKIDVAFPIIANTKWEVMALLCDDTGIPKTAAKRIEVFEKVMAKAKEYGIADSRIHIDPLVEMLCTSEDGIAMVVEVMTYIKSHYPKVHISGAVSNISFNLPVRKLVNQAFCVLAMNAGMDSAVLDPLNQDLMGMIYATEALLGMDEMCMEYIGAYRQGIFGQKK
ncbi:5-methyltetrahydrofolate--homocysteine methyltransferase [Sporobacter termitidis DSM 10068]|uniref:5-methyltetrahydrofolate--homocysteine methyltransferase n=1 Tax=Sporobacter termitidis DSM 10068 TaxID=1123282 RepID=A0A1M5TEG0_9FIRM|nr:methyltetrahydrofolate cobalamin methyltransferase [Sporobacter termitidis]SHH48703.1 5-methyltetrahydrofolate--homocysteine methyltransferase [Sporobacter termitidis DSM 10068]